MMAIMKAKQFLRKLEAAGVRSVPAQGKGGHVRLVHGQHVSILKMHGAKDLEWVYMKEVCKQLGLSIQDVV
jgi:predicted RNA binding protein YcfA (HicA-like mRNA interferase family)